MTSQSPQVGRPGGPARRTSTGDRGPAPILELRGLQHQFAVTERNLVNAQETLRLSRVRRDAGFGEEQDVASAQARVLGSLRGAMQSAYDASATASTSASTSSSTGY